MKNKFIFPRWAAMVWGAVLLFPVGLNYLGCILLILAMLLNKTVWPERWQRLRATPFWWPSLLLILWAIVVWIIRPHYLETTSNVFHFFRIILTLWLLMILSKDEAIFGLMGIAFGLIFGLILHVVNLIYNLPDFSFWYALLNYVGNKSISDALIFALFIAVGVFWGWRWNWLGRICGVFGMAMALWVLGWVLPARSAWIALIVGLWVGVLHWGWGKYWRQMALAAIAGVLSLALLWQIPAVQRPLMQGFTELAAARASGATSGQGSWNIRYRMYTETAEMVEEQPIFGWGLGAWNEKWRERVEPAMADFNMPHNDFLWLMSQLGVPGGILFFWMLVAGARVAWRKKNLNGRLGLIAIAVMLVGMSLNSGLRDASIGMSLWFAVLLLQRLVIEPETVWDQVEGSFRQLVAKSSP